MDIVNQIFLTKFQTKEPVFVHSCNKTRAQVIFMKSPNLGLCPLNLDRIDFENGEIEFKNLEEIHNILNIGVERNKQKDEYYHPHIIEFFKRVKEFVSNIIIPL